MPPLQQLSAQTGNATGPWFTMTHHEIIRKKTETERESLFTNKATGRKKKTIFTNKKPQLLTYGDFQRRKRKQYFNLIPWKICLRLTGGRLAAFRLFMSNTKSMPTQIYTILIYTKNTQQKDYRSLRLTSSGMRHRVVYIDLRWWWR